MTRAEFYVELARLDRGFHRPEPTEQRAAALYDELRRFPLSVWREAVNRLLGDSTHPSRDRILSACVRVEDMEREVERRSSDEASRRFMSGSANVEAAARRDGCSPTWARFWYDLTLELADAMGRRKPDYPAFLKRYEDAYPTFEQERVERRLLTHWGSWLATQARA